MGMFGAGPGSYFGFSGTPGGLSGERKLASDAYFAQLREDMARQRAEVEARNQAKAQQQLAGREMSLKELLGQSQMREASRAASLAESRLGLDANVASADANQRANALSLQERLGWAGENRQSNADQMQNQRANQQLSLQERLGMMSEGRLSRGQEQDEAFRRAQLGQQAELARLPYQMQDANSRAQSDFQNRQLGQQDKQFNRQFSDIPLADRWRNALAEKQQQLDQSNTDRAFTQLSARDQQSGSLEEKRMGMTERLAGNENQLRRDLQGETLKQQLQMWSQLSAAEKQQNAQFGQKLAQDLYEFKNVSGNNRYATRAQERMHNDSQDRADWRHAADLVAGDEDRALRRELSGNENDVRKLGVLADMFGRANIPLDQDFQDGLMGSLGDAFPRLRNSPVANPQERVTRTMLDDLRAASLPDGKPPKTPEELHESNWAAAKQIDAARRAGHFQDETAQKWLKSQAKQTPNGVGSIQQMLDYLERERQKEAERHKSYKNSGFIWTGQ